MTKLTKSQIATAEYERKEAPRRTFSLSYRENYLKSEQWKAFRLGILVDRDCCEDCGLRRSSSRFFYGQDLDIHHLHYKTLGHESPQDVRVLCRVCHEITESLKVSNYPRFGGYPEVIVYCPCCGDHLWLGISHPPKIRTGGWDDPIIQPRGKAYSSSCEGCCIEDPNDAKEVEDFIERHLGNLLDQRRARR